MDVSISGLEDDLYLFLDKNGKIVLAVDYYDLEDMHEGKKKCLEYHKIFRVKGEEFYTIEEIVDG